MPARRLSAEWWCGEGKSVAPMRREREELRLIKTGGAEGASKRVYIIRARVPYFFSPYSRKNPKWVLRGRRCGTARAVPIAAALRSGTPGRPIAGRPRTRPLRRRRDAAGPTARPTRHAHRHWIPVDAVRLAGAHFAHTHTHTHTHRRAHTYSRSRARRPPRCSFRPTSVTPSANAYRCARAGTDTRQTTHTHTHYSHNIWK